MRESNSLHHWTTGEQQACQRVLPSRSHTSLVNVATLPHKFTRVRTERRRVYSQLPRLVFLSLRRSPLNCPRLMLLLNLDSTLLFLHHLLSLLEALHQPYSRVPRLALALEIRRRSVSLRRGVMGRVGEEGCRKGLLELVNRIPSVSHTWRLVAVRRRRGRRGEKREGGREWTRSGRVGGGRDLASWAWLEVDMLYSLNSPGRWRARNGWRERERRTCKRPFQVTRNYPAARLPPRRVSLTRSFVVHSPLARAGRVAVSKSERERICLVVSSFEEAAWSASQALLLAERS